jgi:hypothetical protein
VPEPGELLRMGAAPDASQDEDAQRRARQSCPKLGLVGDPASHATFLTPLHRCNATGRERQVAPDHQAAFCLSRYETCLMYQGASVPFQGQPPRHPVRAVPQRKDAPDTLPAPDPSLGAILRRWAWLAFLIALLGAIGADTLGNGRIRPNLLPVLVCTVALAILAISLVVVVATVLRAQRQWEKR